MAYDVLCRICSFLHVWYLAAFFFIKICPKFRQIVSLAIFLCYPLFAVHLYMFLSLFAPSKIYNIFAWILWLCYEVGVVY